MNTNFITLAEACKLLSITRPTLNAYRLKYQLKDIKIKNRIYLSKLEIIEKIVSTTTFADNENIRISILTTDLNLRKLFIAEDIIDLRGDILLDAFGIISLLCKLKGILKHQDRNVFLLVADTSFCRYLKRLGFFRELEKANMGKVFYNTEVISDDQFALTGSIILPLHSLGYRGAEKKTMEEVFDALLLQGFSENLSGHLGWIVGELSDNCHTHSKGGPCYLMIESKYEEKIPFKFLSLVIGDVGIGIQTSLKTNSKYQDIPDLRALVSAFLSQVSSWPDNAKRGKGLNDILGIALGNQAWMRCESSGLSIFADFIDDNKEIKIVENITDAEGTRIALVLIDNNFRDVTREEVNTEINKLLEKI